MPVDPQIVVVRHYPFTWGGVDFDVTPHFFGARLEAALPLPKVVDADYNLGASWVPLEEALRVIGVHPPIDSAVRAVLASLERG